MIVLEIVLGDGGESNVQALLRDSVTLLARNFKAVRLLESSFLLLVFFIPQSCDHGSVVHILAFPRHLSVCLLCPLCLFHTLCVTRALNYSPFGLQHSFLDFSASLSAWTYHRILK